MDHRDRLKAFFSRKKTLSRPATPVTSSVPPQPEPPSARGPPVVGATSTANQTGTSTSNVHGEGNAASMPLEAPPPGTPPAVSQLPSDPTVAGVKSPMGPKIVIDTADLTLGLVEKLGGLCKAVPFIGPVAGAMKELVKFYKGVKDTKDKRDSLLSRITDISHDLCAAVLRMEAANHIDLIGRLKVDIERYAKSFFLFVLFVVSYSIPNRLLGKVSTFIKGYDQRSVGVRVAAHTQLASELDSLERELDSFGARFRVSTAKMRRPTGWWILP
ncbi:hypothetical protein B0H13DRAFT_1882447 [Mycena leptocephala]|nr:hypothetical protein B0H13DRAFT_1882447 [Mycena leptocephala]